MESTDGDPCPQPARDRSTSPSAPTHRQNSSTRWRKSSAGNGGIRAAQANPRVEKADTADHLRSRFAERDKFRAEPVFLAVFPTGIHGIRGSKKGTDYSVPNRQSRNRPKSIFSGQSGLSPFLKGRTNLVRVNLGNRDRRTFAETGKPGKPGQTDIYRIFRHR